MTLTGDKNKLSHYEWDEDYEDFINRFEEWIDIKKLKLGGVNELYDALHDWLGITKRGRLLPTQPQMDLFSEYFGVENFPVSEYMSDVYKKEQQLAPQFGYIHGTIYNEGTHEVEFRNRKTNKYEHYIGEEKELNIKYVNKRKNTVTFKKVIVIRDVRTKKILAWHKDVTNDKYLGNIMDSG
jgi:hypothetical protein